eukprot:scaffold3765_cov122-Isochrysis_galbana.AAC.16
MSPASVTSTLLSDPQMVPASFDPFQPRPAELAGEDPAVGANADQFTGRQARTPLRAARLTLPMTTPKHQCYQLSPRASQPPLHSTQEDAPDIDQAGGFRESLRKLDQSQHFLLVFTQVPFPK